jgi:hypothetical protein
MTVMIWKRLFVMEFVAWVSLLFWLLFKEMLKLWEKYLKMYTILLKDLTNWTCIFKGKKFKLLSMILFQFIQMVVLSHFQKILEQKYPWFLLRRHLQNFMEAMKIYVMLQQTNVLEIYMEVHLFQVFRQNNLI